MSIQIQSVIAEHGEPWFVTRLNFGGESDLAKFEKFMEKRLHTVDVHPEVSSAIRELKLVYVISRIGSIENNQLQLFTGVYAPIGAQGEFSGDEEVGDLVDIVAFWKPDFASGNFGMKLRLAHERNLRQVEFFFQSETNLPD